MKINETALSGMTQASSHNGRPVATINGVDRARNETAPMRVFARAAIGRHDGYGSLPTALTAARNISRGADRSAVLVERIAEGSFQVFDAVWQYFWGRNQAPDHRAPFRHFHFEDGTASQYTALLGGQKIEVTPTNYTRSYDGVTRWLVDGNRVADVTHLGGRLV